MDIYVKKVDEYRRNKSTMCSIIIGHCTEPLITKLECMDKHDGINSSSDIILHIQAIREIPKLPIYYHAVINETILPILPEETCY